MTRDEYYAFMSANPAFHLATVDGDQPRVRGMFLYRADEDGILFHTGKMKDVYQQLMAQPKTELCFSSFKELRQVRVSGSLELLEDLELKKEIVNHPTRAFLKPWVKESGYEFLAVFRLSNGRATSWTMSANFAPKQYVDL
jgi:uncharacterized pyridoxamine 5'-phosphate oxidase family protein